MKLKKLLATVLTSVILFSMTALTASATDTDTSNADAAVTAAPTEAAVSTDAAATVAPTEAAATVAPTEVPDQYLGVGCYMGFFQIQTTSWVYRNDFNTDNYAAPEFNSVYTATDPHATTTEIKDTVIDGDGDYTVSLNNISLEGSTDFNMVALSTNIAIDSPINITAASLYYDDSLVSDKPIQKVDNKKLRQLMFINQYDTAMKDTVYSKVPMDGSNMVIKFTVEGFGYPNKVVDEAASSDVAATPVATVTAAPADAVAADNMTTEDNKSGALSTGAIIGIIAGAVVVVIVISIIFINSKKKKK